MLIFFLFYNSVAIDTVTWLQLALLPPQNNSFFETFFSSSQPGAIIGLRGDQFVQIPATQYQNVTADQVLLYFCVDLLLLLLLFILALFVFIFISTSFFFLTLTL